MTSFDALERGASQSKPYSNHLFRMPEGPTRYTDDLTIAQWREKNFFSVFEPSAQTGLFAAAIRDQSPLSEAMLPKTREYLEAPNAYMCPAKPEQWPLLQQAGLHRMPAGLPPLDANETKILNDWLARNGTGPSKEARETLMSPGGGSAKAKATVDAWESFLNGDSLKEQLVGRYLYEHSFLTRIHFDETPDEFYEIVRSTTPPGEPVRQVITEWVQDAPPSRPYYRIRRIGRVIDARQHVLWSLSNEALARLKALFHEPSYEVASLPGYESINPFETFKSIPAKSRAAFMRENSKMIMQSYARGPICVGALTTYAGDEQFWVWFLNDDADPTVTNPTLGLPSYETFFDRDRNLQDSFQVRGSKWGESAYRNGFEEEMKRIRPQGLSLSDVWDGDKKDPDAWIVNMRSEVSTNVHTGAEVSLGGLPTSAWLLSYATFERMYYNAAVQFKYWGSVKHKLETFNHQTYTGTEGEDLFLTLLHPTQRAKIRSVWTSSVGEWANGLRKHYGKERPSTVGPEYDLKAIATDQWNRVGAKVRGNADALNGWPSDKPGTGASAENAAFEAKVASITRRYDPFVRFLPNVSYVRLGGKDVYTLLTNRGYMRDKLIFIEKFSRRPEKDELVVVRGLLSATPELFFDVERADGEKFLSELQSVKSKTDWDAFKKQWAVLRDSPKFWSSYDWFNQYSYTQYPKEAGILDLNYYDTRF